MAEAELSTPPAEQRSGSAHAARAARPHCPRHGRILSNSFIVPDLAFGHRSMNPLTRAQTLLGQGGSSGHHGYKRPRSQGVGTPDQQRKRQSSGVRMPRVKVSAQQPKYEPRRPSRTKPSNNSFYRSFAFVDGDQRNAPPTKSANVHYIEWAVPPAPKPPSKPTSSVERQRQRARTPVDDRTTPVVHPAIKEIELLYAPGSNANYAPSAVDLMMSEWMQRFEEERSEYNSMAVYAEMKLGEALRITQHLDQPNDFVTALCCNLLGKLVPEFGPYAQLMEILEGEIIRSIYYDHEKQAAQGQQEQGKLLNQKLFNGVTYRKKEADYRGGVKLLQAQKDVFEEEHATLMLSIKQKHYSFEKSVKQLANQNQSVAFRAWRDYVADKKKHLKRSQMVMKYWLGSKRALMKKVFNGFVRFHEQRKQVLCTVYHCAAGIAGV
jgi:hypothetical protein